MKGKTIFTLLGVLYFQGFCVTADQSGMSGTNNEPISILDAREKAKDTPEVVLQLKYNDGELNKIYLTQFRKESKGWLPSVSGRRNLCADLCRAGLGGSSCGSTCLDLVPVGLTMALDNGNETDLQYGEPRDAVCPVLCENGLGTNKYQLMTSYCGASASKIRAYSTTLLLCVLADIFPTMSNDRYQVYMITTGGEIRQPLCNCNVEVADTVDWNAVCGTFCDTDNYVLHGCPACGDTRIGPAQLSSRLLSTSQGWKLWCNVQCRQGQGGAACNCDKAPFL